MHIFFSKAPTWSNLAKLLPNDSANSLQVMFSFCSPITQVAWPRGSLCWSKNFICNFIKTWFFWGIYARLPSLQNQNVVHSQLVNSHTGCQCCRIITHVTVVPQSLVFSIYVLPHLHLLWCYEITAFLYMNYLFMVFQFLIYVAYEWTKLAQELDGSMNRPYGRL